MPSSSNELRIFISSAFRDLQEEREHLVKKIFPEIRSLCRARGIRFTEVDLRWGLTDENVALGQVIRTCLDEVDKCRPYFIGITGDRYGFVPTYVDIQKDPELLEQYPWIEDAAIDGMSITEMEAQFGVLNPPTESLPSISSSTSTPARRARFYFRRHRATLDGPSDTNEGLQRLEAYQQRIRDAGTNVQEYRDPSLLGELIYDDLIEIIKRDFADAKPPTPLEEERARHAAFALSRRRAYIANPRYLKRLNEHVASDDPPLVVYAESGSGKSSLFAFWAEQYRRKHPEAHVIEHYVGIGATSTDHYAIIQHLCMEIKERFAREEDIPTTPEELQKAFGQWLGYADHALKKNGEHMVVILDGLNQLQGSALNLRWIPPSIAPSIRLILGSTVEGTLLELEQRGWKRLGMQALDEAEREAVVVRYLAEYRKSLNAEQIKRIAGDYKCGHPLFLKTLLEELRLVGQHDLLVERITGYLESTGTEDLFQRVLERLEDDYSQRAVRDVMSLLWASRSGLDDRELSEVSGLARLKIATMIAGLDYHLVRKEGRLTFFHDYLRRAVEKRYVTDEQNKQRTHLRLAAYFEQSELNRRTASERMWQYAQAGDDAKLIETLANLDVLQLLCAETNTNEVLTQWARLREAGHDPEAIYHRSIERGISGEPAQQIKARSTVASVLERLGLWGGAIDIERSALEEATRHGLETEAVTAELSLGWLLHLRGDYDEARERLERGLRAHKNSGDRLGEAQAAHRLASLHHRQGEYDRSHELLLRSMEIYEQLGDRRGLTSSIRGLGAIYYARGKYDRAMEFMRRELSIAEELGDLDQIATINGNMGMIHSDRDEHDLALQAFQRSLSKAEELGDLAGIGLVSNNMGLVYAQMSQYDRAMECFERRLALAEQMGDRSGVAGANNNMAMVYRGREERDKALECYRRSLAIERELGDTRGSGIAVGNMSVIYADRGDYDRALECYAQATNAHRTVDYPYGLTYWLSGTALALFKIVRTADSIPEYLAKYVPDATESNWRRLSLDVARENAEECKRISTELQKPDTLRTSTVVLAQLDAEEGNADAARAGLTELMDRARSDSDRANCHYWLWKLELDPDVDHRGEAERIYHTLVETDPGDDHKQRLEELRSAGGAS